MRFVMKASCAPDALLLSQFDRAGLGTDGNPVLVERLDQDLPHVFVVRVKVEDVSHHVGQTLTREFLLGCDMKEKELKTITGGRK